MVYLEKSVPIQKVKQDQIKTFTTVMKKEKSKSIIQFMRAHFSA